MHTAVSNTENINIGFALLFIESQVDDAKGRLVARFSRHKKKSGWSKKKHTHADTQNTYYLSVERQSVFLLYDRSVRTTIGLLVLQQYFHHRSIRCMTTRLCTAGYILAFVGHRAVQLESTSRVSQAANQNSNNHASLPVSRDRILT